MENISINVSSNPPHFALRWVQNATSSTPTLFISDISIIYKCRKGGKPKTESENIEETICSLHNFSNKNE